MRLWHTLAKGPNKKHHRKRRYSLCVRVYLSARFVNSDPPPLSLPDKHASSPLFRCLLILKPGRRYDATSPSSLKTLLGADFYDKDNAFELFALFDAQKRKSRHFFDTSLGGTGWVTIGSPVNTPLPKRRPESRDQTEGFHNGRPYLVCARVRTTFSAWFDAGKPSISSASANPSE